MNQDNSKYDNSRETAHPFLLDNRHVEIITYIVAFRICVWINFYTPVTNFLFYRFIFGHPKFEYANLSGASSMGATIALQVQELKM